MRYERWLDAGLAVLVTLFVAGWLYAIAIARGSGIRPPSVAAVATNPLSSRAPPATAYLLDRAVLAFADLTGFRGRSGDVRIIIAEGDSVALPDSLPPDVDLRFREFGRRDGRDGRAVTAPARPAIWNVLLQLRGAVRAVPDLNVLTLVPLSERRDGRLGGYLVGRWPFESGGRPPSAAYAPPSGLVRVTAENQDLQVSTHFQLRDFLTKGQVEVWPKYVAISPRLLDKLELTIDELEATGHPVKDAGVISGFRTPEYNVSGGSPGGRGELSRHMYGDAMDIFIDNDGDGRMDDLNRDGEVDREDGRVIVRAAERVEQKYPQLIGGIGLYSPTGAHAGFVHIDTRGYRARW